MKRKHFTAFEWEQIVQGMRGDSTVGQYHRLVNLDRKEHVSPHELDDGLKLLEQAASGPGGIGSALILLLACSNGRGGGDAEVDNIVGTWAGDHIVIVGDYTDDGDYAWRPGTDDPPSSVYGLCREHNNADDECACDGNPQWHYKDITPQIRASLAANLEILYHGEGWMKRTQMDQMGIPGFQYTHRGGNGRRLARAGNVDYYVDDLITAWERTRKCAEAASGRRDWEPDWAEVLKALTPVKG